MIEKYLPNLWNKRCKTPAHREEYFAASDLETELAVATKVYAKQSNPKFLWGGEREAYDTHEAILIGIQPLNRKVKRSDIEKFLRSELNDPSVADSEEYCDAIALLERILENGFES